MKIKTKTKDLASALAKLSLIPGANTAFPFTQAVRFEADISGLKLTRFTAESIVSCAFEGAEIIEDGDSFSAPYAPLVDLVGQMIGEDIELSVQGQDLVATCGKQRGKRQLYAEEEGIEPPAKEDVKSCSFEMAEFRAALADAAKAMSDNNTRPELCGVGIAMHGDELWFKGSNGRRVHVCRLPGHKIEKGGIISAEGVQAILRVTEGEQGKVALGFSDSRVQIETADSEISCSLIGMDYPNIEPLMKPKKSDLLAEIKVPLLPLRDFLVRAGKFGAQGSNQVEVEVSEKLFKGRGSDGLGTEMSFELECVSSGESSFICNASDVAAALGMMVPDKGQVDLKLYSGALFIEQEIRTAFFALMRAA